MRYPLAGSALAATGDLIMEAYDRIFKSRFLCICNSGIRAGARVEGSHYINRVHSLIDFQTNYTNYAFHAII